MDCHLHNFIIRLSFAEVFISVYFIGSNSKYHEIVNFTDKVQNNNIYYEKIISDLMNCIQFKYMNSKQLKNKQKIIYSFELYHQNDRNFMNFMNFSYYLHLSSDINYPNLQTDNPLIY